MRRRRTSSSSGIAHVPEGRRLWPDMSVEDNLLLGAYPRRARGEARTELERVYAIFPRVAERRTQIAGTLSGGEQQMVAIGRGLMSKPSILMLDEPSLGLAPIIVAEMFETVRRINAAGTTVLLVEQNVRQALELATRGYVDRNRPRRQQRHPRRAASQRRNPTKPTWDSEPEAARAGAVFRLCPSRCGGGRRSGRGASAP